MKKIFVLLLMIAASLKAHDLQHTVVQKQATVVIFSFGGDVNFSYQKYEVYAPNSKLPFAVGRTDSLSRVVFVPNKTGMWKIKAISEDGHGASIKINIDESMKISNYTQSFYEKFQKTFVGLALIFALYTFVHFIINRRKIK